MIKITLIFFVFTGIYTVQAQTMPGNTKNSGIPLNTERPDSSSLNTPAPSGNNPNYYQPPMPTTDQPINEPQNTPTHPTESAEPTYQDKPKKRVK